LRRLAIVQVLGDASDSGYGTDPPEQIANLHRSTTLGWSVPQRAQWDSINALIRVVASPTVSAAVSRIGQVNTWTLGVLAYCSHTIPMALATQNWHIYATLPSHALIMHRVSVERVMVAKTGVATVSSRHPRATLCATSQGAAIKHLVSVCSSCVCLTCLSYESHAVCMVVRMSLNRVILSGVCPRGAARYVSESKDGCGHFVATVLVKAVRGGEHGTYNLLHHTTVHVTVKMQ
jgi:hypothetical protein